MSSSIRGADTTSVIPEDSCAPLSTSHLTRGTMARRCASGCGSDSTTPDGMSGTAPETPPTCEDQPMRSVDETLARVLGGAVRDLRGPGPVVRRGGGGRAGTARLRPGGCGRVRGTQRGRAVRGYRPGDA